MNLIAAILCTLVGMLNVGVWIVGATSKPWVSATIAIGCGVLAFLNWRVCYQSLSRQENETTK